MADGPEALAPPPRSRPAWSGRRPDVAGGAPRRTSSGFGVNPGQLEMVSYIPPRLEPAAPLVVALHGCGQEAAAYAEAAGWLTLADRIGFAVLAPRQTAANNPNRCFNWFLREDIARGSGEVASIAAMIAFMIADSALDPRRVFITGLSAGGAMALAMLASYSELFAGGAVFGAIPYGVAGDVGQAMRAMRHAGRASAAELGGLAPGFGGRALPPLTVWHGGHDTVVTPGNGAAIAAQWALAQGLSETPDAREVGVGRSRSLWRRHGGGEIAVELNIIDALGHGVPLATCGPEGLGRTAPFMLEAGVSSSLEVARFWGLIPQGPPTMLARPAAAGLGGEAAIETDGPSVAFADGVARPPPDRLGDQVMASLGEHLPAGVHDVIAKALRAGGLMK